MRYALLLGLAATIGIAQTDTPRSTTEERTPRSGNKAGTDVNDPSVDYWDSMSDYFRNSRRAVMAIRDKGIPDEEVPVVLYIARNSSASPNQIIDARKSGKSWPDIARQFKANVKSDDLVTEANTAFLSSYHGRTPDEVKKLREKGTSWVEINQEFRRVGGDAAAGTRTRQR